MSKTTPPPIKDVLEVLPELASKTTTTIRLHPRRGIVEDQAGSKISGLFLWPQDEEWPFCIPEKPAWWYDPGIGDWKPTFPTGAKIAAIPVLQINARDVPDFQFPVDKDLMQVFWCPLQESTPPYFAHPIVVWRNTSLVTNPITDTPSSPYADPDFLIPHPCTLTFECVKEYPDLLQLTRDQRERLRNWDVADALTEDIDSASYFYQLELSTCPCTKLGGWPDWLQDPEIPICPKCGQAMDYLLTLADTEADSGTYRRWVPIEDRHFWDDIWSHELNFHAPGWQLGSGNLYIFVCRACEDWPIQAVYQR